ncbi:MAG: OmpA family protein [Smithella sp.]
MKKLGILSLVVMTMAFVVAVNAEARPGGLSDVNIDSTIKDCSCPPCCPKPVAEVKKEKLTITLNVQFDTNKAVVKEKYHDEIKRVADFMKKYPDATAVIEGHTDSIADNDYNQKLSEARSSNVRQYLIDMFGIDGFRLTAQGYGEDNPIADNDTEEGRQKNRRVDAVLEAEIIK